MIPPPELLPIKLPKDDLFFLDSLGLEWSLELDPTVEVGRPKTGFLVIKDFDVSGGGFSPASTDLMIRIPALYNMTPLDMWHCFPRITINGKSPAMAENHVDALGRRWQMFSRHLASGAWKPGRDGLRSFFPFIFRELQGKP